MSLKQIKILLKKSTPAKKPVARFFKTGKGEYAEKDKFIGIPVPILRKIAKQYIYLSIEEVYLLLKSSFNEERMLALFILIKRYQLGDLKEKNKIYQFYLKNLKFVNNWNLVDGSAPFIIGVHLLDLDKKILLSLSRSDDLWEKRIAIVSTWYFIRHHQFNLTLKIAKILLKDEHDLIHKAVGWMLREVGKKDIDLLRRFLDQHASVMPRTMLRYAIERLPTHHRKYYLLKA